ncbi:MAG: hypothetical protein M1818_002234 [Claussenomyces sp. TS43310]|nr:MAG: hypothetical protein M1818_002234 [Claussenomyces sp. TS43310]
MGDLLSVLGLGQFGNNSHPIHPATVHMPITFLIAASAMDMITAIGLRSPSLLFPLMKITTSSGYPNALDEVALLKYLSLFSYASTVAAILTSFPALATGIAELYAMVSAKGLDLSDPVIKTTLIHAALNDVAIAGAFYNWLTRRGRTGYEVQSGNILTSAAMLVGIIYSAYLGGSLVYTHGVAVQRMGEGKKEKEKGERTKPKDKKEL